jgi:FkbM family methyltransferase
VRLWTDWYPGSHIVAVEPSADNFALALLNCSRFEQVRLIQGAAYASAGFVHFNARGEPWSYQTVSEPTSETVEVKAITVPSLIELFPTRRVDLLKCDIEGAEMAIFSNCEVWINCVRAMVVETHAPYSLQKLQEDLRRCGSSHRLQEKQGAVAGNEVGFFA